MKRMMLLLYVVFFSIMAVYAMEEGVKSSYRDSIMALAGQMSSDTVRLSYLREMAHRYQYPPYNKFFAEILYEESKRQENLFYENHGAYYLACYYDKKHDPDSLTYWVEKLKEFAPIVGTYDYYLEQKAALSRALASKRMIEKAVFVAKETLDEAIKRNNQIGKIAAYNSLGCAYTVSSRKKQALEVLLKAYKEFTPDTKKKLKIDVLSRITQIYGAMGDDSLKMRYLIEMDRSLQEAVAQEPEARDNWTDIEIDCEVKYVLYYLNKEEFEQAKLHIDKAQALLAPHTDPVYWLNIQLIRLQYFSRTKEYDKSIALIDEVTPMVLKNYVSTFAVLINYKVSTQRDKGDIDGAIATSRYLMRTQDSLNNAFSAEQLEQVKEIYHVDRLLMEKQKISNENYVQIFIILLVFLFLSLLFYIYTRYLSKKITLAEKEAAEAALHSEEDNKTKERLKMEISHDVRTPLNAVVGFAELLSESDDLDKESKLSYGKIIQENAEQLLEYVNNILELSRLESGKIQYERDEVEIVGLCREIISLTNRQGEDNVEIVLHTSVDSQVVCTDKKWFISLLRGLLASGGEDTDSTLTVYIESDETLAALVFRVVGTPLAQKNVKDKKRLIRNEINSHFIRYFGGSYMVKADTDEGPTIIFTCPLLI
ncbi:sensor histidine kinase [Bacteroides sp.]